MSTHLILHKYKLRDETRTNKLMKEEEDEMEKNLLIQHTKWSGAQQNAHVYTFYNKVIPKKKPVRLILSKISNF